MNIYMFEEYGLEGLLAAFVSAILAGIFYLFTWDIKVFFTIWVIAFIVLFYVVHKIGSENGD